MPLAVMSDSVGAIVRAPYVFRYLHILLYVRPVPYLYPTPLSQSLRFLLLVFPLTPRECAMRNLVGIAVKCCVGMIELSKFMKELNINYFI